MRKIQVFVSAAAAVAGLALGRGAAAQDPTPPLPEHSGREVKSPGNAQWAGDVAEATARAQAEKALVYYEFDSAGCGNCRRMQSLLYPAFDFEALLIGMVPVQVDIASEEGKRLAERYLVKETPSILITTPSGRLVFLMQGFHNAPDFYRHAHTDLDSYRKFARIVDAQNVATLSAEEAYKTGKELYLRYDFAAAAPRLERAAKAPDGDAKLREDALEGLAAAELELGHTERSRKAIDRLLAMTTEPRRKQNAELFRAQLALAQENPAEALTLYKKFAKDHPDSPYLEQVRSFIARLEASAPTPKS